MIHITRYRVQIVCRRVGLLFDLDGTSIYINLQDIVKCHSGYYWHHNPLVMLSILGVIDLSLSNWDHILEIKGAFFVSLETKPKIP